LGVVLEHARLTTMYLGVRRSIKCGDMNKPLARIGQRFMSQFVDGLLRRLGDYLARTKVVQLEPMG
jgi:hypothetical protein